MRAIQRRLSYANVMATLGVFLALGGGAFAVASAEKNTVTSRSVKNDSLRGKDIRESTLRFSRGAAYEGYSDQTQAIPASTATKLTFNNDEVINGFTHASPAEITATRSGRYLIQGSLRYGGTAAGPLPLRVLVNNNSSPAGTRSENVTVATPVQFEIAHLVDLNAGDIVTLSAGGGTGAVSAVADGPAGVPSAQLLITEVR